MYDPTVLFFIQTTKKTLKMLVQGSGAQRTFQLIFSCIDIYFSVAKINLIILFNDEKYSI